MRTIINLEFTKSLLARYQNITGNNFLGANMLFLDSILFGEDDTPNNTSISQVIYQEFNNTNNIITFQRLGLINLTLLSKLIKNLEHNYFNISKLTQFDETINQDKSFLQFAISYFKQEKLPRSPNASPYVSNAHKGQTGETINRGQIYLPFVFSFLKQDKLLQLPNASPVLNAHRGQTGKTINRGQMYLQFTHSFLKQEKLCQLVNANLLIEKSDKGQIVLQSQINQFIGSIFGKILKTATFTSLVRPRFQNILEFYNKLNTQLLISNSSNTAEQYYPSNLQKPFQSTYSTNLDLKWTVQRSQIFSTNILTKAIALNTFKPILVSLKASLLDNQGALLGMTSSLTVLQNTTEQSTERNLSKSLTQIQITLSEVKTIQPIGSVNEKTLQLNKSLFSFDLENFVKQIVMRQEGHTLSEAITQWNILLRFHTRTKSTNFPINQFADNVYRKTLIFQHSNDEHLAQQTEWRFLQKTVKLLSSRNRLFIDNITIFKPLFYNKNSYRFAVDCSKTKIISQSNLFRRSMILLMNKKALNTYQRKISQTAPSFQFAKFTQNLMLQKKFMTAHTNYSELNKNFTDQNQNRISLQQLFSFKESSKNKNKQPFLSKLVRQLNLQIKMNSEQYLYEKYKLEQKGTQIFQRIRTGIKLFDQLLILKKVNPMTSVLFSNLAEVQSNKGTSIQSNPKKHPVDTLETKTSALISSIRFVYRQETMQQPGKAKIHQSQRVTSVKFIKEKRHSDNKCEILNAPGRVPPKTAQQRNQERLQSNSSEKITSLSSTQILRLSDQVYRVLERRLQIEKMRRGMK